jgi:hypothetical protein
VPATSPQLVKPKKFKSVAVVLPSLYLVKVESWDEHIFKIALMTADSSWSCGGQDDDLS